MQNSRGRTMKFLPLGLLSLLLLLPFFSGCIVSNMLALESARINLLNDNVNAFHKAVYWGSPEEVAGIVAPEAQMEFLSKTRKQRRTEKLVDMEVENIIFNEGSTSATVDVQVKYYRIADYLVKTRREREKWEFSFLGRCWYYKGAEALPTDDEPS